MKLNGWTVVLLIVLAYFVGVKFPTTGQTLLSKVGM
jgi:hypothetical protein